MNSAAIDDQKLIEFCQRIRQLPQLMPVEKREVLEILLREVDLVRQEDTEALLCVRHAIEARGYAHGLSHSNLYRLISRESRSMKVYRICCRDYFSRRELESQPPPSKRSVAKVRVGMKGK